MSKRNIVSTVVRETVIGEAAPLSYVGVYVGYGTVHLDASTKSGQTTHRVGLRTTPEGAKELAIRLVKELAITPQELGIEVESVEIDS